MGINMGWTSMVVMVALVVAVGWSEASSSNMDCAAGLKACNSPLHNSTETPTATCCKPLSDAVKNQTACLCSLFNNKPLFVNFNITTEQVFALTARCNISASPSMCSSSGPATAPVTSSPPPAMTNTGSTCTVVAWSGIALILAVMATFLF